MNIVLHIGTEKTGTSTIQSLINANSELLSLNGFFSPASFRPDGSGDNQIILPALFSAGAKKDNLLIKSGMLPHESVYDFSKKIITSFENELFFAQNNGFENILISSEHLSSRLHTHDEVQSLSDFLGKYGAVSKIVVYLRRQDLFLVSSYSTGLKSGRVKEFCIPGQKWAKKRYDYRSLIQRWGDVFGYDSIIVRPFEEIRLINNDLIDDFMHYVGLVNSAPVIRTDNKNVSLDPKSLSILLHYNQWAAGSKYEDKDKLRSRLVSLLERSSGKERMRLSGNDATAFVERFSEGNDWVSSNFLTCDEPLFMESIDPDQQVYMPPKVDPDAIFPLMESLYEEQRSFKDRLLSRVHNQAISRKSMFSRFISLLK